LAGGAVPADGGVVIALERMARVRALEPGCWRIAVDAGLTTAHAQRIARENGLFLPPNPGAAEQSQLGGNLATNAAGPRAFKYGSIGGFVTGLEVAIPPGELLSIGGAASRDVAGCWLRLLPAPDTRATAVAFYPSTERLAAGVLGVLASGRVPAAVEYLDGGALSAVASTYPGDLPPAAAGAILVELDGSGREVAAAAEEIAEALGSSSLARPLTVTGPRSDRLLAWRESVSSAVAAQAGAKLSEDVSVPVEHLAQVIDAVIELGARHGLQACSWGHAGNGTIHASFLVSPESDEELTRAQQAAAELFSLTIDVGGSVSGEHGVGMLKRELLERQWPGPAVRLHRDIKSLFDPKNLMNPGKKLP
jgi:FAD/FMN-containing dehydrogenase